MNVLKHIHSHRSHGSGVEQSIKKDAWHEFTCGADSTIHGVSRERNSTRVEEVTYRVVSEAHASVVIAHGEEVVHDALCSDERQCMVG